MGRTERAFEDAGRSVDYWIDHAAGRATLARGSGDAMKPVARHVLHIAGRVTGAVFSFLRPTLRALDSAGVRQTLVFLDWPDSQLAPADLPPGVALVAVPIQGSSWRNWARLSLTVDHLFHAEACDIDAIHLHGLMPYLLGGRFGTRFPADVATYFTPHGSRSMHLLRSLSGRVIRRMGKRQALSVIASSPGDASMLSSASVTALLVESPVETDFFNVERQESATPHVVSGSMIEDDPAVHLFSRMAVVLGAAELGLQFDWLGRAGADGQAQLKAAGVCRFDGASSAELAQRLASAWLFVATQGSREFPSLLACAMAAGLACLAPDTERHRELIRHGETGFIYGSESEALQLLTMLLDDPALRNSLGLAARADASARFRAEHLDAAIRLAYHT